MMNIMKILLTKFYKNWFIEEEEEEGRKKKINDRKVQFNLVNGINLVVDKNHFLFLRQAAWKIIWLSIRMMFALFVDDEIINLFVLETNRYSTTKIKLIPCSRCISQHH